MLNVPLLNYWEAPFSCLCLGCSAIEHLVMNHAAWQTRHHGFDMFWLHRAKHCDRTNSQNLLMLGHLVGFLSLKCFKVSHHPTSFHCCMRWSDRKKLAENRLLEEIVCTCLVWGSAVVPKGCPETLVSFERSGNPRSPFFCTVGHTPLGSRFVYLNRGCSPDLFWSTIQLRTTNTTSVCAPMRQVLYKHASSLGKRVPLAQMLLSLNKNPSRFGKTRVTPSVGPRHEFWPHDTSKQWTEFLEFLGFIWLPGKLLQAITWFPEHNTK